jgi:uncharacterized protein YqeY
MAGVVIGSTLSEVVRYGPSMIDEPAPVPLRERLRSDLTAAMKDRDSLAVGALRSVLGAIDNAEAVAHEPQSMSTDGPIAGARPGLGAGEAARLDLSETDVAAVVHAEIADRLDAAALYERAGATDRAGHLRAEAGVLSALLGDDWPHSP